jgi:hypothetical protein
MFDEKVYKRKWKLAHPNYDKEFKKAHPDIIKAQKIAQRKIPLKPKCEMCGCDKTVRKIQRCHMDYNKPLEVHFWCVKCHHIIDQSIVPNITNPKITNLLFNKDLMVTFSL